MNNNGELQELLAIKRALIDSNASQAEIEAINQAIEMCEADDE